MNNTWIIAKRELRTFFDSLIAYILLAAFLLISGFFTWIYGFLASDVFMSNQADMRTFFIHALIAIFLFVPAITMRMIAEERKNGTLETLLTRSVSDWQVVSGKFLAGLLLIIIALAFTLPYYFVIAWLGPVDHGAVWCGYIGLILLSASYLGIGIFISSITDNQIVAFLITLLVGIVFFIGFGTVGGNNGGVFGETLNYLSMFTHYSSFERGVIDLRDVLYFVSLALLGLILAEMQLSKRNIIS